MQFDKGKSMYSGEVADGEFEGEGMLHSTNGNIYKGSFKKGKREGLGMFKSSNGNIYKYDSF